MGALDSAGAGRPWNSRGAAQRRGPRGPSCGSGVVPGVGPIVQRPRVPPGQHSPARASAGTRSPSSRRCATLSTAANSRVHGREPTCRRGRARSPTPRHPVCWGSALRAADPQGFGHPPPRRCPAQPIWLEHGRPDPDHAAGRAGSCHANRRVTASLPSRVLAHGARVGALAQSG